MKRKLLWIIVGAALVMLAVTVLAPVRPRGARRISARFARQTIDPARGLHLFYEITNGTGEPTEVAESAPLQVLHERTGWWDSSGWTTAWHVDKASGTARDSARADLRPHSAGTLEVAFRWSHGEGSASRGRLWTIKVESEWVLRLRAAADRLGMPRRWQMMPTPRWIDLPEAAFHNSASPVVAAAPPALPPPVALPGAHPAPAPTRSSAEEVTPAGLIQFQNCSLRMVLDIYTALADSQVELDSRVRASRALFSFTNTATLRRSEVVQLLELALEQQGRIAVSHVGQKRSRLVPVESPPGDPGK